VSETGDIHQAVRTALRIRDERRRELRAALDSGDPAEVVRWARRELGLPVEEPAEEE
jgi:hypothetical protein